MTSFFLRSTPALVRCTLLGAGALMAAPSFGQLDRTLNAQIEADRAAGQAQEEVNGIRDQTADAAARYAQFLAEAESLEDYNEQLAEQVESLEAEIASIEQQLVDIETTNREVQPLMEKMVMALETFVSLDVPIFIEERTNRVQNLKDILLRADVAISEKYRRIMEAYQIELEYGRTLSAYEGRLPDDRTVEFIQLGRVSLMYRTLDGSEVGYWDNMAKQWVADEDYSDDITEALRVAREDGAPDLLRVPVPAPVEVSR
jgi:cell division septum initiation protein DivIVA